MPTVCSSAWTAAACVQDGVVDDNKNRALPQSLFCKLLGDKMGGESVVPGQIHKMLQRQFGSDASAKSIKYLGMAQAFLQSQAAGGGQNAQAAGLLAKLLGMCMSATPTQVRDHFLRDPRMLPSSLPPSGSM